MQQNDLRWTSVERHQSTIIASRGDIKDINTAERDQMKSNCPICANQGGSILLQSPVTLIRAAWRQSHRSEEHASIFSRGCVICHPRPPEPALYKNASLL